MLTKPNNRGGDRESTWKRIQNQDSKDDPKSWKQNGVTDKQTRDKDWEEEMFNQVLEEVKKGQSIMDNAITKIKNTLQGTNSRKTEVEERISEVEDTMVGINEAES